MTKCSVKKEIIPHGTQLSCKPVDGALISFSGMQSALALFFRSRELLVILSAQKNKEVEYGQQIIIKAREAGA